MKKKLYTVEYTELMSYIEVVDADTLDDAHKEFHDMLTSGEFEPEDATVLEYSVKCDWGDKGEAEERVYVKED